MKTLFPPLTSLLFALALAPGLTAQTSPKVDQPADTDIIVVDRVEIKGNDITRETIIRRELALLPGDTLTQEKIALSTEAISSTNLFSKVEITSEESTTGKSVVTVTVKEKRFPSPYPTVGIDASTGFYLGIGALYPNLFGQGLLIDAGGEMGFRFSTPRWRAFATLAMPMTYNRWHAENLGYDYTYFWRKDAQINRMEHNASYRQDIRPWRPLVLSLELGWLQTRAYGRDSLTPLPTFSPDTTDRSVYVKPSFVLDMRDNAAYPTKGFLVAGQYFYNPGLSENFMTQNACSLSVAGYIPLTPKMVIAGNVFTYQQLDSIPVYRTIYIGKDRFLRGWKDTTQVGPCLSIGSLEWRWRWLDFDVKNFPVLGRLSGWWAASVGLDVGAIHEPGLPPLYLADLDVSNKDGLLMGTNVGLGLGLGKWFTGKLEVAWGVGSGLNGRKLVITVPAYFGWRF